MKAFDPTDLRGSLSERCLKVAWSESEAEWRVPETPVRLLDEIVGALIAAEVRKGERDEDEISDDYADVRSVDPWIAGQGGKQETLIRFEWWNMFDWVSSLDLITFDGSEGFIAFCHEPADWDVESPVEIIGCLTRAEHGPLLERLIGELLSDGGDAAGIALISSLPSQTVNERADLIPRSAIETGYRRFLDSRPGPRWAALLGQMELDNSTSDPRSQLSILLRSLADKGIEGSLEEAQRREEAAEALSEAEKDAFLAAYLERSYREYGA